MVGNRCLVSFFSFGWRNFICFMLLSYTVAEIFFKDCVFANVSYFYHLSDNGRLIPALDAGYHLISLLHLQPAWSVL